MYHVSIDQDVSLAESFPLTTPQIASKAKETFSPQLSVAQRNYGVENQPTLGLHPESGYLWLIVQVLRTQNHMPVQPQPTWAQPHPYPLVFLHRRVTSWSTKESIWDTLHSVSVSRCHPSIWRWVCPGLLCASSQKQRQANQHRTPMYSSHD